MKLIKIVQEIEINASADKVYKHITNDVTAWWNHSFSKNPKAVVLEPKRGGHFYEEFSDGGFAIFATVMHHVPGKKLVLHGPMGMSGAVFGAIEFELESRGNSTMLRLSYDAMGDVDDETYSSYSGGWTKLSQRLKELVETGSIQ